MRFIKLSLIYVNMSYRVKSAAEIEEEMLAKIPKFKARPLPKKVLTPEIYSFAAFDDKKIYIDIKQHNSASQYIYVWRAI